MGYYMYGATCPIVLGKDDLVSRKIGYNVWSGVTVNNVTFTFLNLDL